MSLVEFYDEMAQVALGWLGWTEAEALAADVNAIQIAYEGKLDLFETIGFIKRGAAIEDLPELGPGMLSRR